ATALRFWRLLRAFTENITMRLLRMGGKELIELVVEINDVFCAAPVIAQIFEVGQHQRFFLFVDDIEHELRISAAKSVNTLFRIAYKRKTHLVGRHRVVS